MFHLAKELGPTQDPRQHGRAHLDVGPAGAEYVQWQVADRRLSEDEVIGEITATCPLGEIPADEDVAEVGVFLSAPTAPA